MRLVADAHKSATNHEQMMDLLNRDGHKCGTRADYEKVIARRRAFKRFCNEFFSEYKKQTA